MVSAILPIVEGPGGVLGYFLGDEFIPLNPGVLDPTPTPEPTPDPTPTPDGSGTPTPTPDTGTPTPSGEGIPVIGPDGSVIGEIIDGVFVPIETPTPDPIPTPDGETPTPTPDGGGTPTPTPDGGGTPTPTPTPTPGSGDISVVLDDNGNIIGFIIDGVFRPINGTPTPTPGNVPGPLAVDDQVITNQNQATTFNVLENDIDPNGKPVRVGNFSLPQNGSLVDNGSGSFTYTPRQFYIGPDNFSYSATNGTSTSLATVSITVISEGAPIRVQGIYQGNPTNEFIIGSDLPDVIFGAGGDDTIFGAGANDELRGEDGNDVINGNEGNDTVVGNTGNDNVRGGKENDLVTGDEGNDTVYGDRENDSVDGGDGNDLMFGGKDNDFLSGGSGDDIINGDRGNDVINGNAGNDTILGGDENDTLLGSDGEDILFGESGTDRLFGGIGSDTLSGDLGDDELSGDSGNDSLSGGSGVDLLRGGEDNDTLDGGDANDSLLGESGNDSLIGGFGADTMTGGEGSDTFVIAPDSGGVDVFDADVITDFRINTDIIRLTGGLRPNNLEILPSTTGLGNDSVIRFGSSGDYLVVIQGIDADTLKQAGNAIFGDSNVPTPEPTPGPTPEPTPGPTPEPTPFNRPPIAENDQIKTNIDQRVTFDVLTNDSDPDGDPIRVIDFGSTINGKLTQSENIFDAGGVFTYVPDIGFTGTDSFSYVITDQNATASAIVSISINSPPRLINNTGLVVKKNAAAGAPPNYILSDNLLVDDLDNTPAEIIYQLTETVKLGQLRIGNAKTLGQDSTFSQDDIDNNLLQYTPLNIAGRDTFSFTVADGDGGNVSQTSFVIGVVDEIIALGPKNNLFIGSDTLSENILGQEGNDTINGLDKDDYIGGGPGDDSLLGGAGDDSVDGGDQSDQLFGGVGRDILRGGDGSDTLMGEAGTDSLYGDADADSLNGGESDDFLFGGAGNDTIADNEGNERVFGEAGNDLISTGEGDDTVDGGTGNDTIDGGIDDDSLLGGDGADSMNGGVGRNTLRGGIDDDTLLGGIDNDLLYGDDDNDSLRGFEGNDTLFGGFGSDRLSGDIGNDTLFGGENADTLVAGDGNDWLSGGSAPDRLTGGLGNDSFFYEEYENEGTDNITDFAREGNDFFVFRSSNFGDHTQPDFSSVVLLKSNVGKSGLDISKAGLIIFEDEFNDVQIVNATLKNQNGAGDQGAFFLYWNAPSKSYTLGFDPNLADDSLPAYNLATLPNIANNVNEVSTIITASNFLFI